jgi:hypothetical protein
MRRRPWLRAASDASPTRAQWTVVSGKLCLVISLCSFMLMSSWSSLEGVASIPFHFYRVLVREKASCTDHTAPSSGVVVDCRERDLSLELLVGCSFVRGFLSACMTCTHRLGQRHQAVIDFSVAAEKAFRFGVCILVECDQDLLHHLACSDISLIRRKQKASLGCQPAVRRDVMEPLLLTSEMNAPLLRFVFAQSEYRSKTWTTKPSSLSSRTCPTDHTKAFGSEDDFAFSAFGSNRIKSWR